MTKATDFVNSAIQENKVAFFGKTFCPYCKKAKTLLETEYGDAQVKIFELDEMDDGEEIQKALQGISGQNTVPNIFINTKHIGGNSDLQALHNQKILAKIIAK